MLVAVTGASGHLGANLLRALIAAGETVRVVTIEGLNEPLPAISGLAVERFQGDVLRPELLEAPFEGVDVIYNLAGKISIVPWDAEIVWRINTEGPANVARMARLAGVRRMVHVGSIHSIAGAPGEVVDENSPSVSDLNAPAYDRSKAAGHRAVMMEVEEGLDAVTVLPTSIIGPWDHLPSRMGKLLRDVWVNRLPAAVSGGFDWVDVRDVAAGMMLAAEHGRTGDRYLLGGHYAMLTELTGMAAAMVDTGAPPMLPTGVIRAVAPAAEAFARVTGSNPLFTRDALDALTHHAGVDHGKARGELGYEPRPLAETLQDTLEWWQGHAAREGGRRIPKRAT